MSARAIASGELSGAAALWPAPGLAEIERPRGRDLSGPELLEFVERLAKRPELWRERVRHDPGQRVYEQLLVEANVSAWLICWMNDHDTGFHDHDTSCGAVAVVRGAVREQRLVIGGAPLEQTLPAGGGFHFSATDIHRVSHAGSEPAVTLHAYSPPLLRMGSYAIADNGALVRRAMSYLEELGAQPARAGGSAGARY